METQLGSSLHWQKSCQEWDAKWSTYACSQQDVADKISWHTRSAVYPQVPDWVWSCGCCWRISTMQEVQFNILYLIIHEHTQLHNIKFFMYCNIPSYPISPLQLYRSITFQRKDSGSWAATLVERCLCVTAFQTVRFHIAYQCSWWSCITQLYKMGCWWWPYFQCSNRKELKTVDSSALQMHIVLQWARTPTTLTITKVECRDIFDSIHCTWHSSLL